MTCQTFLSDRVSMHCGDSRDVLATLPDCSVDSVVTDPPYSLVSIVKRFGKEGSAPAKGDVYARATAGFMGKQWDTGETAFAVEFWAQVLRVLKPGGHVCAFSGTRTYHRMTCAIEDAGFEIRDQIGYCFGSGFPKSHNVGDGWGTALKPAWEPICLARKPLIGTVAANVLQHGTGALNIDGCRIHADDAQGGEYTVKRFKPGATLRAEGGTWKGDKADYLGTMKPGRWPANLIHDGSDEVLAGFPASDARPAKAILAGGVSGSGKKGQSDVYGAGREYLARTGYADDETSAARFFYTAKADADDRLGSKHPTVKPLDLMQYLVRLVTPKGGTVLDPFAGTGTTGEAAWREGMRAILIEREEEYQADIARRMDLATKPTKRAAVAASKNNLDDPQSLPLFAGAAE